MLYCIRHHIVCSDLFNWALDILSVFIRTSTKDVERALAECERDGGGSSQPAMEDGVMPRSSHNLSNIKLILWSLQRRQNLLSVSGCMSMSADHWIHMALTLSMCQRFRCFNVCEYDDGECKGIPMVIGSLNDGLCPRCWWVEDLLRACTELACCLEVSSLIRLCNTVWHFLVDTLATHLL